MRDADTPAPAQTARPTAPTRPKEETARLGDEIYERDIRHKVEADHHGEIVSIDVDTGLWAIGDDILDAVERPVIQGVVKVGGSGNISSNCITPN